MTDKIYVVKDKDGKHHSHCHVYYKQSADNLAESLREQFPNYAPYTIQEYIPAPQWVPELNERLKLVFNELSGMGVETWITGTIGSVISGLDEISPAPPKEQE